MKKITPILLLNVCFFLFAHLCRGQIISEFDFGDTNGIYPQGSLTLSLADSGRDTVLYGMTSYGGAYNEGLIFSIKNNMSGFKDLHDFEDSLGANPFSSLTLTGNKLYGLTNEGGTYNYGCIFTMDTDGGNYKVLVNFTDTDGAYPHGSLAAADSLLYGTTSMGGIFNYGCIFSIDTNGKGYTILHSFNDTDGASCNGSLTLANSILYGMTTRGGQYDSGCVFALNMQKPADSAYKDLHDFNLALGEGGSPSGDVTYSSGVLYGMTTLGGANYLGCVFSLDTDGTGYADLLDFNDSNGAYPHGSLLPLKLSEAHTSGLLYGMTGQGGALGYGCVFSINISGITYKKLLDFNFNDGAYPAGNLLLSGGVLNGMTEYGGADNVGVIFSMDTNGTTSPSAIPVIMASSPGIEVYPNPNEGEFTIKWSVPAKMTGSDGVSRQWSVEIYNMLGEQVYTYTPDVYSQGGQPPSNGGGISSRNYCGINLSAQPDGVYLYRVLNENGELTGEGRVVIER